jgi:hypothetical protein
MSMSEAGALLFAVDVSSGDQKAGNRAGDHRDAESNQRICARAATAGGRPRTARNLEKQVELLDNEAEGHHRDGGAHPGEEGMLVAE